MIAGPFDHERKNAIGQRPLEHSRRANFNRGLVLTVDRVKVWRSVFPPVHLNNDTKKSADRRHGPMMKPPTCDPITDGTPVSLSQRGTGSSRPRRALPRSCRTCWAAPQRVGRVRRPSRRSARRIEFHVAGLRKEGMHVPASSTLGGYAEVPG